MKLQHELEDLCRQLVLLDNKTWIVFALKLCQIFLGQLSVACATETAADYTTFTMYMLQVCQTYI